MSMYSQHLAQQSANSSLSDNGERGETLSESDTHQLYSKMANSNDICLLDVMDHLWFNKIVLFSQPNSILLPKTIMTTRAAAHLEEVSILGSSMASVPEDEILNLGSSTSFTPLQDDSSSNEEESEGEYESKERSTRLHIYASKTSSQSSSPSTQNQSRNLIYSSPVKRLQKTMSCKTLLELQEEEVKGFTDLGFKFSAENLCPRMTSLVPGLQRLEGCYNNEEQNEGGSIVLRPYLSEAWLIKRPDLLLLNPRVPKLSTIIDMKKHIKCWARTVASEI